MTTVTIPTPNWINDDPNLKEIGEEWVEFWLCCRPFDITYFMKVWLPHPWYWVTADRRSVLDEMYTGSEGGHYMSLALSHMKGYLQREMKYELWDATWSCTPSVLPT